MATITKTQGTSLLSLQSLASNSVVISSAQDVSTKLAATVFIHFGRRAATALTEGVEFRIEASAKSSGDGFWWPLAAFKTAIAAAESEAVSGTVSAGTNVITVAATSGLVAGDLVYIDNGTIGNSEWGRVKSISTNTSITIEDNLLNAQTGATIYDQAEYFAAQIDLTAVGRIRVVADGRNTGQAVAVEALMVTGDSIG
jgi:hypothetical protein